MDTIKTRLRAYQADKQDVDNGQQVQPRPLMVNFVGGHIFTVPCTLDGKETKGIVDSGAQLTVVSAGLLKKLGIRKPLKRTQKLLIQTASGEPSAPKGKFQGQIQLKGRTFEQEIFVLDSTHESLLLLGTDFSFNARLVIDFYDRSVSFRDEYGENQDDDEDTSTKDEGFSSNEKKNVSAPEIRLNVYRPPRPISPMEPDPPFAEAPLMQTSKMAAGYSKNEPKKQVNIKKITKKLAKIDIVAKSTTGTKPKSDIMHKRRRISKP